MHSGGMPVASTVSGEGKINSKAQVDGNKEIGARCQIGFVFFPLLIWWSLMPVRDSDTG